MLALGRAAGSPFADPGPRRPRSVARAVAPAACATRCSTVVRIAEGDLVSRGPWARARRRGDGVDLPHGRDAVGALIFTPHGRDRLHRVLAGDERHASRPTRNAEVRTAGRFLRRRAVAGAGPDRASNLCAEHDAIESARAELASLRDAPMPGGVLLLDGRNDAARGRTASPAPRGGGDGDMLVRVTDGLGGRLERSSAIPQSTPSRQRISSGVVRVCLRRRDVSGDARPQLPAGGAPRGRRDDRPHRRQHGGRTTARPSTRTRRVVAVATKR